MIPICLFSAPSSLWHVEDWGKCGLDAIAIASAELKSAMEITYPKCKHGYGET